MRHLAQGLVVAVAICRISTAYAVDHNMVVSEVQLSKGGDNQVQFVELEDPFGESFPNNPYTLEVFNAAATRIGTVSLSVPAATTRYFIATDAADPGGTRDAALTVALPTDGQLCFTRGTFRIYCMAWGCIDTLLVGATRAPSPPDDMSIQREPNGFYQVATPTPDAANIAGTTMSNCPGEPDAPPPVDAPPAVDGPSTDAGSVDADDTGRGDAGRFSDDSPAGGCCQVDGSRGAIGAILLALAVLVVLRKKR